MLPTGKNDKGEDDLTDSNYWGLPLNVAFSLSQEFYRDKNEKAVHLQYADRIKLYALAKQAKYGAFQPDLFVDVGLLDFVGNDRRQAWKTLGDLTKEQAMIEFIDILKQSCPLLGVFMQAQRTELEYQEQKRREEEERRKQEEEVRRLREQQEAELQQQMLLEQQRLVMHEQYIRQYLNQQTAVQFKLYAEQVHPNDPELQRQLIAHLQEQHYQQYLGQVSERPRGSAERDASQIRDQQRLQQLQQAQLSASGAQPGPGAAVKSPTDFGAVDAAQTPDSTDYDRPDTANGLYKTAAELPRIEAASMWTKKTVKEFKEQLRNDADSVITIGSGETVTIRVPTHEDGTCIFWEFATDSYDVGFGVMFEWATADTEARADKSVISVEVNDSDADEAAEAAAKKGDGKVAFVVGGDADGRQSAAGGQNGTAAAAAPSGSAGQPELDEIVPVYRRNSHEQVFCGSHVYPGRGVYLLRYDNSYSLWRSKTLYYRVYYTK